jgi:two-component system alkaline phosphatase synthesis response regulator PhoP
MAKRILAVDDEPRVLAMIQKRLETAGYEVITATEGQEALKKAHAEQPDLIVLDLILPGLNGYQICAMLKKDELYRDIPILMLTARSQEQDVSEGMRVGADAYMTKPYDSEAFLFQVAGLLGKREQKRLAEEEKQIERSKDSTRKFL